MSSNKPSIAFQRYLRFFFFLKVMLAWVLPLADDETYHWTWTQNLSASYFDHPGMIAWLEYLTTSVFGNSAFAIRLPALGLYFGALFFLYRLSKGLYSQKVAELTTLVFTLSPLWGIAGVVAAPELPMVFCWVWGLYVFYRAVRPDPPKPRLASTWIQLGIVFGLGLNSKLIIVLLAFGMAFFFLTHIDEAKRHLRTPWPWIGIAIAVVLATPVFIWNLQHHWPSFEYQFYRRHHGGGGFSLNRGLGFIGYQILFMNPIVFAGLATAFALGFFRRQDFKYRFLWAMALPTISIFWVQAFFAEYKPHWAANGYLTLLPLSLYIYTNGSSWLSKWKSAPRFMLGFAILFHSLIYIPMIWPIAPWVHSLSHPKEEWNPLWDFTNEFYGWKELGEEVKKEQLRLLDKTGVRPRLAAKRYELVSQLWYHTQEQVYKLSNEVDHFKFLQEDQKTPLLGYDYLMISNDKYPHEPQESTKFSSCEKREFKTYRSGYHSRTFFIWYCRNLQKVF